MVEKWCMWMPVDDVGIRRKGRIVFYALIYLSICTSWRIRATSARVVHEREYIRKSY